MTFDAFAPRTSGLITRQSFASNEKYTEEAGAPEGARQEIESLQVKTIMRDAARDNEQSFSITLYSHLLESRGDSACRLLLLLLLFHRGICMHIANAPCGGVVVVAAALISV